jgi:hypothetical protein
MVLSYFDCGLFFAPLAKNNPQSKKESTMLPQAKKSLR